MTQPEPALNQPRRNNLQRLLISVAIFAPIGAVTGYLLGRALKKAAPGETLTSLTLADGFSLLIAVLLIVSGAVVAFAATSNRRWNSIVEHQPADEPVDPAARTAGLRQSLVCILAGGMMMLPPIAAQAGLSVEARGAIAAAIGLLLAFQTWLNLKLWGEGDELQRAVIAQTGALCFWTLQLALFGWAALARLDLVAEVDSWTMFTLLMGVYLIVSLTISQRRGLVPG
ncbi:MAG: hypothetical protein C0500_08985 [Sphingobium sp.]|nr:hypothetical protein [Sphingobium sp.]